jgi:hypothetical protein
MNLPRIASVVIRTPLPAVSPPLKPGATAALWHLSAKRNSRRPNGIVRRRCHRVPLPVVDRLAHPLCPGRGPVTALSRA